MIKAVIVGTAHMHANEIALYITEQPDFTLCGVADLAPETPEKTQTRYTRGWNIKNISKTYNAKIYADFCDMLDTEKPDIAFILCENCNKPYVVEECAKRHINVSIEKPIAINYEEALKIQKSVDKHGIEAVVNWPTTWRAYIHKMKNALDNKVVGEPIKLSYINGHTGPLGKGAKHRGVSENAEEMTDEQRGATWWHKKSCGGGAYLDICCYGCMYSCWIMGSEALGVYSYGANLNTPFGDTEDNIAAIIRYQDKMSVIEGTWTTPRAVIPSGPMAVCTGGVVVCTGGAESLPDVKAYDIYGNDVEIPDVVLPESFKNMPNHLAEHILKGAPLHETVKLDMNMQIMRLLDASIKSCKIGSEIKL